MENEKVAEQPAVDPPAQTNSAVETKEATKEATKETTAETTVEATNPDILTKEDLQPFLDQQSKNDKVLMQSQADQQEQLDQIQETQSQQIEQQAATSEVSIIGEQWTDMQFWVEDGQSLGNAWASIFLGIVIGFIAVKGFFDSWR